MRVAIPKMAVVTGNVIGVEMLRPPSPSSPLDRVCAAAVCVTLAIGGGRISPRGGGDGGDGGQGGQERVDTRGGNPLALGEGRGLDQL